MTTLFIGAGFSKWAADLPLVSQLFDFNISNIRHNDDLWFSKLRSHKADWDRQFIGTNEEAYIRYILTQSHPRYERYLVKYIARRLSEQFLARIYGGSLLGLMIDDKLVSSHEGVIKARTFFEHIGLQDVRGIITTNYDMLIEYAISTKRFTYGDKHIELKGMGRNRTFPWENTPILADGNILLSKLHGSISYDGEFYWTTAKPGINGKSVILPPSPEKTKDLRFAYEWDNAQKTLSNTNRLIIFGFNFNEYDQAVLNLLKCSAKSVTDVIIYDIESKLDKAGKIWEPCKISEYNVSKLFR